MISAVLDTWQQADLLEFEHVLRSELHNLETREVAELYILTFNKITGKNSTLTVDGYISDDNFLYFRCWIILQGVEFVKSIQQNINTIMDLPLSVLDTVWSDGGGEQLLYVTDRGEDTKIRDLACENFPDLDYDFSSKEVELPRAGVEICRAFPGLAVYLQRHSAWYGE